MYLSSTFSSLLAFIFLINSSSFYITSAAPVRKSEAAISHELHYNSPALGLVNSGTESPIYSSDSASTIHHLLHPVSAQDLTFPSSITDRPGSIIKKDSEGNEAHTVPSWLSSLGIGGNKGVTITAKPGVLSAPAGYGRYTEDLDLPTRETSSAPHRYRITPPWRKDQIEETHDYGEFVSAPSPEVNNHIRSELERILSSGTTASLSVAEDHTTPSLAKMGSERIQNGELKTWPLASAQGGPVKSESPEHNTSEVPNKDNAIVERVYDNDTPSSILPTLSNLKYESGLTTPGYSPSFHNPRFSRYRSTYSNLHTWAPRPDDLHPTPNSLEYLAQLPNRPSSASYTPWTTTNTGYSPLDGNTVFNPTTGEKEVQLPNLTGWNRGWNINENGEAERDYYAAVEETGNRGYHDAWVYNQWDRTNKRRLETNKIYEAMNTPVEGSGITLENTSLPPGMEPPPKAENKSQGGFFSRLNSFGDTASALFDVHVLGKTPERVASDKKVLGYASTKREHVWRSLKDSEPGKEFLHTLGNWVNQGLDSRWGKGKRRTGRRKSDKVWMWGSG